MSTVEQAIEDEKSGKIEEVKVDELEQLRNDLSAANRRISDTYQSYLSGQERINSLEKALLEQSRQASRPAILDETEGLQDAIRFVAESVRNDPTEEDKWISIVARAIPEANQLMEDPTFAAAATAARSRVGERAWKDPITAIREIAHLKSEFLKQKAVESERQTREVSSSRTDAMSVPGGGGKARREAPVDEAKRIWDMSKEDFLNMTRKVSTGV